MASNLLKRRWATAIVFVVLTTIGVVASVASWWTHQVLFDTDTWMETVGPIGTDEVVTDALTDKVSAELIDWIDAQNRLEELLPPRLAPVAGLLAPLVNDLIVEETGDFFESEFYGNAWLEVNETAHRAAVAIIRDQLPFASTAGGVVTLDLIPVLQPIADRVFMRLGQLGDALDVLADRLTIDDTIDQVVQTYQEEGLPDRLGAVEVYSSDDLAAIQQWTALLDRLIWILPIVTLLFAAGAIYFAPNRWHVAIALLGAAALGWLLAGWAVNLIVGSIVGGIETPTTAAVAEQIFSGVLDGLINLLIWLAVAAGVLSLGVFAWDYYSGRRDSEQEAIAA